MNSHAEKQFLVYKHTNKKNGKVYIGQTCQNVGKRWRDGAGYVGCTYFYSAIKKYGWDNFDHEILLRGLTESEANEAEKGFIKQYDSTNHKNGYNLRTGGKNGLMPEEAKAKISKSISGAKNPFYGKHHSAETKEKLREQRIGRHLSEETKRKMSESTKGKFSEERLRRISERVMGENNPFYGKKHSKKSREKMSKYQRSKKLSDETKEKISRATSGKNNPMYGKHRSESVKKRLRESRSKPVICIETGEVFESALVAQEKTGAPNGGIGKCCAGKQKTSGKYHWKFLSEAD